jgi:RNA polymerase sigma-70 factor, ECF subfamily
MEAYMGVALVNSIESTQVVFRNAGLLNDRSEKELIEDAQCGCSNAFEKIVEKYKTRMFRVADNITHRREDAEEATQSAFVKAYRNLGQFRGDSSFSTWLTRITVNEALMKIRKRPTKEISIDEFENSKDGSPVRELQDSGPTPEERYRQKELRNILTTTIGQLPLGYRSVFQLRDVEGLSTEETAQILGLSACSVKTRLRRARYALRPLLQDCLGRR